MTIIVCLGNAQPRHLARHPQPPQAASISYLEMFARDVCGLDISGVQAVGEWMVDANGAPSYEITPEHRAVLLRELIAKPFEVPYEGPKSRTVFEIPTDAEGNPLDSLLEILLTIKRGWPTHANATPGWIAGTDEFLVSVVQREMKIAEVREWLPTGERGEINYQPFYGE